MRMQVPKMPRYSKTPIERHREKLKSRDGALVLRARRISLFMLLAFTLLVLTAAGLMILGIGIPGRAWSL